MTVKNIELTPYEYAQLNLLILNLIDAPAFVKEVMESIEEEKDNAPENFMNEDYVEITESDIDRHIEKVFNHKFDVKHVPTCVYEYFYEEYNRLKLDEWEQEIKEMWRDMKEYNKDPLAYNGMSQKDFL